jgi:hypothetical protein
VSEADFRVDLDDPAVAWGKLIDLKDLFPQTISRDTDDRPWTTLSDVALRLLAY